MGLFFGWIILSIILGVMGSDRTCGFAGAFFGSLFLSPLVGAIILFSSTKKSTLEFQKKMLESQRGYEPSPSLPVRRADPSTYTAADFISDMEDLDRKLAKGIIYPAEYEQMKEGLKRKAGKF